MAKATKIAPAQEDPSAKQKLFYERYIQSQKYRERLAKQKYEDIDAIIEARLRNVHNTKSELVGSGASYYDLIDSKKVLLDTTQPAFRDYPETVKAHEFGHVAGDMRVIGNPYLRMNSEDSLALSKRNKATNPHDSRPHEFKADMDALRYLLRKDRIYDASTQDFTPELLKKVKDKYNTDPAVGRLLKNSKSDEDLIYLMNTVAANNPNESNTAKNGNEIMAKSAKPKKPIPKPEQGPQYVNDPSLQALSDILLWKNRNKNFIDRAAHPENNPSVQTNKLPGLQDQNIPDYVNSTHLMAHDLDKFSGKGRVYPMLVQKSPGAGLDYLNPDEAYNYANSTGQYVETPSYPLADYFSKQGYKMASDNLYGTDYKKYMKNESGGTVPNNRFMKIDPRYLDYNGLQEAASGMYMDPGPRIPGLSTTMQAIMHEPPRDFQAQMPQQVYDPNAAITTAQLPPINTNKVVPSSPSPKKNSVTPHMQGQKFNAGTAAVLGGQALSAILSENPKKQQVVQPQMAYNPLNYGLGSQALMENGGYIMGEDENNSPSAKNGKTMKSKKIKKYDGGGIVPYLFQGMTDLFGNLGDAAQAVMNPSSLLGGAGGGAAGMLPIGKDGNWIQKAVNPAHKGYCTPMTKSTCTPKRKALAKTFKKHHGFHKKEDGGFIAEGWDQYAGGGIISDNMSNFSPHQYEHGGDVNGCAKVKNVGPDYPNTDLMEQWLLYQDGGDVPKSKSPARKGPDYNFQYMHREPNAQDSAVYLDLYNRAKAGDPSAIDMFNEFKGRNTDMFGLSQGMSPLAGSVQDPRYRRDISPMERYNQALTRENALEDAASDAQVPAPFGAAKPFKGKKGKVGANVNGGAKIREVGPNYPNSDLIEQWLLYANGGNVNGGAKVKDVGANYPNTDLLEQWLLYKNGGSTKGDRSGRNVNSIYPASDVNEPILWAKDGAQLSADKAKEMLRDGTANGKKLTAKQKRYFGMVAGGKAVTGAELAFTGPESGDPKKPQPNNNPVLPPLQFKGASSLTGTNAQADNVFAMDFPDRRMAYGIDMINNVVSSGLLPNQTNSDKILRGHLDPQMYTYLYQFNQRSDLKGMTPEQRVQAFYNIPANDPNIQAMKSNMKRYGYGPQEFRRSQPAAIPSITTTAKMKSGGVMYDDGGDVQTMWGGNADLESYNPYDGGTIEFNGQSHDDGGIGMAYNGSPIEVEGGEYASKDGDGNLHIYGNMYIPGTKTKFKKAAGAIADKEKRYDFLKTKGSDLVNNSNPANKYDQLAFNSGRVMMQGGQMGQQDLASKKERLASLQKNMLDMAAQHGFDPFEMSKGKMKKAKGGASIPFFKNGGSDPDSNDPTRADRNMNPGNIKYGEFAKKYGAKKDKDGFAIFKDRATGERAMKELLTSNTYKNLPASEAIKKWTGKHPYRYDLGPLTEKKISEMNPDELSIVMGTMTKGEGTRYGLTPRPTPGRVPTTTPTPSTPFTPYTIPDYPLSNPVPGTNPANPVPPYDFLDVPDEKALPSNVEPLGLNNVMGEIYAAATNRPEPVSQQRYEPQLFNPYQVSFQDRINSNQSAFNAQMRAVGAGNPAALGTLGAQKYQADQQVYGDEFRTNQGIANDITNKNIALVNDANLKNLGLANTQMVRQSQARSKTKELNQMIVNSLSDKYAKNELENKRLAAYENLYDYRFVPTDDGGEKAKYFGPDAYFNYNGKVDGSKKPQDVRTISRYDAQGNLKGYADYDESDLREQQRLIDLEMKKRKLPLMPVRPLGK